MPLDLAIFGSFMQPAISRSGLMLGQHRQCFEWTSYILPRDISVKLVFASACVSGADLDRVHRVSEPCQRFQIYQIKGLET